MVRNSAFWYHHQVAELLWKSFVSQKLQKRKVCWPGCASLSRGISARRSACGVIRPSSPPRAGVAIHEEVLPSPRGESRWAVPNPPVPRVTTTPVTNVLLVHLPNLMTSTSLSTRGTQSLLHMRRSGGRRLNWRCSTRALMRSPKISRKKVLRLRASTSDQ